MRTYQIIQSGRCLNIWMSWYMIIGLKQECRKIFEQIGKALSTQFTYLLTYLGQGGAQISRMGMCQLCQLPVFALFHKRINKLHERCLENLLGTWPLYLLNYLNSEIDKYRDRLVASSYGKQLDILTSWWICTYLPCLLIYLSREVINQISRETGGYIPTLPLSLSN